MRKVGTIFIPNFNSGRLPVGAGLDEESPARAHAAELS